MEVRQIIRQGAALSAIAHALMLALIVLFSEVHPFGRLTAEPIAVDLVRSDEIEKKPDPPEPTPTPQKPPLDLTQLAKPDAAKPETKPETRPETKSDTKSDTKAEAAKPEMTKQAAAAATPPAATPAADPPQRQTTVPNRSEAQARPQPAPSSPTASPSPGLGYTPAEPDVTVKYNVILGLPEGVAPTPAASGSRPGYDFDATASAPADLSSNLIGEFRRHLKTCAKLPASVAPSDALVVKLRVLMTVDGRLAADPLVGGGSANPKAFDLLHSAIDALKACQPYSMLPADRYREWKVLDLDLTPKDFSS
jgi:outer membrane biosynthesis protein TonB